nr:hypothetical protein [Vibrio coralliilyticus]
MRSTPEMAIWMVSHNEAEAALADKRIRIVDGKIVHKEELQNEFAN